MTKSQTTIYHPFPDSSSVWNIHFNMLCLTGNSNEYYSITISDDTIIQSKTYHKLIIPFVESEHSGVCDLTTKGYKGAMRQDKANRKVFFIPPSENTEQLLYDFNLHVGDTVKGFLESYSYYPDTVKSIDSILVGNTYRKSWRINTCYNINLIEGIGSTYGLIVPSPGCSTDHADYSISCFQQNGQSIYPETSTICQIITSIYSNNKDLDQINVYPNPSNGTITIDFDKADLKIIQLIDILGNIVIEKQLVNQKKTDITNIPNGIYLLRIITQNKMIRNVKIISCP
jgi:hypothetical protein